MMHFWFSLEQAVERRMQKLPMIFCLIDGEEKEYTTMGETEDHGCNWSDMEYLGNGKYSRAEPVRI